MKLIYVYKCLRCEKIFSDTHKVYDTDYKSPFPINKYAEHICEPNNHGIGAGVGYDLCDDNGVCL